MSLAPGACLGAYNVLSLLGVGGMGEVYLAEDPRLGRQVALKRLSATRLGAPDASERLLHEARAAATLNHPNIAGIYDILDADGCKWIVMEYVPGETLWSALRRGPFPIDRVVDIGLQLADALIAAHGRGVVHRDLKPANVHLTPEGRIKVLDFGIARTLPGAADSGDAHPTPAGTSRVVGTPGYTPPEQLLGQPADQRGDIYSAGVLLFELLTGRLPREPRAPLDAALPALTDPAPEAADLDPRVPRPLSNVIARAIATRPRDRYQSASELRAALKQAAATIGEQPTRTLAGGTPDGSRPTLASRRSLRWVALGVVLAACLVAFPFVRGRQAAPAREPAKAGGVRSATTLAVLPLENLSGNRNLADWPALTQALLAGELTGVPDLAVMDPLGLNELVENQAPGSVGRADGRTLRVLERAKVGLAIGGGVLPRDNGYQLQASVVDTASGESKYTARASVANEQALPGAVGLLARQILDFLQVSVLQVGNDRDLRPWISFRDQKIEAVKAFVQASQYLYRRQRGEGEKYLRRAIELDANFVAPRVWLLRGLINEGQTQEAKAMYQALLALESKASPFEQALIAYAGALLGGDQGAQARELEVALKYSPGNNILLVNLAYLRFSTGDCAAAVDAIRPTVEMRWAYAPLYPLWAFCSVETGHRQDAVEGIDRALALDTGVNPDTYGLLEAVAIAAGDRTRAARCQELYTARMRELRLPGASRELVAFFERLAAHCERTGSYGEAEALYRRAIAIAREHDADTARERLRSLESAGRVERR
jgi:tetratricopeptide (TPR) repeat protein